MTKITRKSIFTDAEREANRWIPVTERLPEAQKRVLAFYTNEYGKKRIETACYIPPKTVLAADFLSDDAEGVDEYDEEKDCHWVIEGW